MIDGKYEYFAFISYKEEDAEWAKWLQRKLEHYKLPTALRKENPDLPERISPIYEYKSEAGGGRLKEVIWKGLTSSKYLIVICSPRATKSDWLNNGIRYFVESGQEVNIIPFILEGKPKADNPEEECFPSELLKLTGDRELRGININEMGRDAATVKVVSRMFDVKFDSLWQRYEREQKRKRWMWLIFMLSIIMTIFIIVFLIFKNTTLKEVNIKMLENQSRYLAEKVNSLIDEGDSYTARLLALKALSPERPYTYEAGTSLLNVSAHNSAIIRNYGGHAIYSPNGEYIASIKNETIYLIESSTGQGIKSWQWGHSGLSVSFSNKGEFLIIISNNDNNGGVAIWSLENDEIVCPDYNKSIVSTATSPNDKFLVTASNDSTIIIWNVEDMRQKNLKRFNSPVTSIAYSPKGDCIAAISKGVIYIMDANTLNVKETLNTIENIHTLQFSNDSKKLICGLGHEGTVIYDRHRKNIFKIEEQFLSAFNSENKIVTCNLDSYMLTPPVYIWNLDNNTKSDSIDSSIISQDYSASVSPDNRFLLESNSDIIKIIELKKPNLNKVFVPYTKYRNAKWKPDYAPMIASYSHDGKFIISASCNRGEGVVKVWNTDNCELTDSFAALTDVPILTKTILLNDNRHCALYANGHLSIIDLKKREKQVINKHICNKHVFGKKGKDLIFLSDDSIFKWNADLCTVEKIGSGFESISALNTDGTLLAASSFKVPNKNVFDYYCIFWDIEKHKKIRQVKLNTSVSGFFSPQGKYFGAVTNDSILKVFEVYSGKMIISVRHDFSCSKSQIAFSRDNNRIAISSTDGSILVYGIDGKLQYKMEGKSKSRWKRNINSIEFSPNGEFLLIAAEGGTIETIYCPPVKRLIEKNGIRFQKRQLNSEERQKFYLEQ